MHITPKPGFLSYARDENSIAAEALEAALGSALVFRDVSDMVPGEGITERLIDALFAARVIVLMLGPAYFMRQYCRAEYAVTLRGQTLALAHRGKAPTIIVALPSETDRSLLDRLPDTLRDRNWPKVTNTAELEVLVRRALQDADACSLDSQLDPTEQALLRSQLREAAMLPHRQHPDPSVPLLSFPDYPPGRFHGRLALIHQALSALQAPEGMQRAILYGQPGAGKTRLARELVWRYVHRHFRGGLVWLNASHAGSRVLQLHRALCVFDPSTPSLTEFLAAGRDLTSELIAAVLRRSTPEPVLWVVDQLQGATPAEAIESLSEWCPFPPGQISLLVTTPLRLTQCGELIEIGALPRPEALQMLQGALPSAVDPALLSQVLDRVGDWPLALHLLTSGLRSGVLAAPQLRTLLDAEFATQFLSKLAVDLHTELPGSSLADILLAFRLSFETLSNEARILAGRLAWLGARPIPRELMERLTAGVPTSALQHLIGHGLVERTEDPNVAGVLHPLILDFLRQTEEAADGWEALESHILGWLDALDVRDSDIWPFMLLMLPHLEVLERHSIAPAPVRWRLRSFRAMALELAGDQHAKVRLSRQTIAETLEVLPPTHPEVLRFRLEYAIFLGREDPEGGLRESTEVGDLLASTLGPESRETFKARYHQIAYLRRLGRLEEALELAQYCIPREWELRGWSTTDVLQESGQYAGLLSDLGQPEAAQQVLEHILPTAMTILPPNSELRHSLQTSLAYIAVQRGAYPLALKTMRQICSLSLGSGTVTQELLNGHHNFAELLALQGYLPDAIALEQQVLARYQTLYDDASVEVLRTRLHLRRMEGLMGDPQALADLTEIAGKFEKQFDVSHNLTAKARFYEALVAWTHGDPGGLLPATAAACPPEEKSPLIVKRYTWRTRALAAQASIHHANQVPAVLEQLAQLADRTAAELAPSHPEVLFINLLRGLALVHHSPDDARNVLRRVYGDMGAVYPLIHWECTRAGTTLLSLLAPDAAESARLREELAWLLEADRESLTMTQRADQELLQALQPPPPTSSIAV